VRHLSCKGVTESIKDISFIVTPRWLAPRRRCGILRSLWRALRIRPNEVLVNHRDGTRPERNPAASPSGARPPAAVRVAVVTGVDGGIGEAVALRLAAERFHLVLHHLETMSEQIRQLCDGIGTGGNTCIAVDGDFVDPVAAQQLMARAMEHFGRVDVLVNNAAWSPGRVAVEDCSSEFIDRVWAVNVRAPLLLIGMFAKQARAWSAGGSVINISSIHARHSVSGCAAYAASKGAIDAMTRQLAVELGPAGIRINAVAPGFVEVPRTVQGRAPADVLRMATRTPLKRNGEPEDIAALVAFLCSPEARHITGQSYVIDGGTSCVLPTHPLEAEDA